MAYRSLYRRYRPQRFAEVRGQTLLVEALRNAVRDERVGHAYLFSGPRGTGKTTTARILAKALNCTAIDDGEPCGTCDSCEAIERGTSFDLHELDAASNRGIGEMRALLDTIALGTPGRSKVYILDEVHMLTKEASAALLKTLEEPPSHVVFVLATTDPQKVLPTIRSRTQHFELGLLPADDLAGLVDHVVGDAGLDVSTEQIAYALRKGGGSARDTLSVLDQVASAGSAPELADVLGDLLDGLAADDPGRVLAAVQSALTAGREPRVIGEELVERLREAFLIVLGVEVPQLGPAGVEAARAVADQMGPRRITRTLEVVGEALVEMRQAADPRIPLEVALLRVCRPEADEGIDALRDRVARLEARLDAGGAAPAAASDPAPQREPGERSEPDPPVQPAGTSASAAATEAPTAGRGSGAAQARAALAGSGSASAKPALGAHKAEGGAPKRQAATEPSKAAAASTETRVARATSPEASKAAAATQVSEGTAASTGARESEAAPSVAPSASATATAVLDSALPSRDELTLAWGDSILGALAQKARSRWASGRFLAVEADHVRFALPNDIHCKRAGEVQAEVEAALEAHFGRPVPVRLEVDTDSAPPPDALEPFPEVPSRVLSAEEVDEALAEVGPIEDLDDADDAAASGVERLTRAFPGAELVGDEVDESGTAG